MAPVTVARASVPEPRAPVSLAKLAAAQGTHHHGTRPLEPQPSYSAGLNESITKGFSSWLKCSEVVELLTSAREGGLPFSHAPAVLPPGGTLLLYDRVKVKYFRNDGHVWRKKPDGKAVRETHEKLKLDQVVMLNCYYAHAIEPENLQRRCYWLLDSKDSIVLVHYLQVTPEMGNSAGRGKRSSLDSIDMWSARSPMPDTSMSKSNTSSFVSPSSQLDNGEVTSGVARGDPCNDWNFYSLHSHGISNRRRSSMDPASLMGRGSSDFSSRPRPNFQADSKTVTQKPMFNSFTGEAMHTQSPIADAGDIIEHLSSLDCGADPVIVFEDAVDQMPFGYDSNNSSGSFNQNAMPNQSSLQNRQVMRHGASNVQEPLQQVMSSPPAQPGLKSPYGSDGLFLSHSSISSTDEVQVQVQNQSMEHPGTIPPHPNIPASETPIAPFDTLDDELLHLMSMDLVATVRKSLDSEQSPVATCSTSYSYSIAETCPAVVQPRSCHRVVMVVDGMEDFNPRSQTFSVNVGGVLCEPVWIQNGIISFTTPALEEGFVQIALVNNQQQPWQQLSPLFTLKVAPDMSVKIFQRSTLPGTDRTQQMGLVCLLLRNRSAADVCSLVG